MSAEIAMILAVTVVSLAGILTGSKELVTTPKEVCVVTGEVEKIVFRVDEHQTEFWVKDKKDPIICEE